MYRFLLIFGLLRIGEASNPGPSAHFDADIFTVGMFNPSGLRNKSHFFQSHLSFGDVWTVSETHFFGRDAARFRTGLKLVQSQHKYCITDSNSLKRGLTSDSTWKGVGVISRFPTRPLPSEVPKHILDSGRALLFTSLVGDTWMSGAVVYGEPNGHLYPAYLRNNEVLLHHVAAHVVNLCAGPRFVSGDWNVVQDSLPAFDILTRAGFRDLQDIALERWGQPIQHTCKGRTRKDFLYVSPELQDLLVGVEVMHDVWPDHSVMYGQFRAFAHSPPVYVWPTPDSFPWPGEFQTAVTWSASEDPTCQYSQFWSQVETDAAAQCPFPACSSMTGRASRQEPKKIRKGLFAPVKFGRKGDFQPGFFGSSVKHSQWLRQVRRLQAFARLASSPNPSLGIQRAESWGAILRAKGFSPDFQSWWRTCGFKTGCAPMFCPLFPPDVQVAQEMFDSMSLALRKLESDLMKQSRQYAQFRRDQNPNLVFADIRPSAAPGVDVLLQPIRATVEAVDFETGQITLDHSCDFQTDHVISCSGRPLQVIHHDSDALWISNPADVQMGSMITQTRFVGSHDDLANAFLNAWKERWMRHSDVPHDRWNLIVDFAKRYLPPGRFQWGSLTATDFANIARLKKKRSACGFDGVTLNDLRHLPEPALGALCEMFRHAELTGQWPEQLVHGKVVSLAKNDCPGSPADFRPITVFSLVYRVWSSFHARKALSSLDSVLPDTLYGSRPGCYAAQVWAKLLWCIEQSFDQSVELTGMVADLQKAFNMLPRLPIFEMAGHLGLPGELLVAWAGALSQMKRRFLLRGSLTRGLSSVTGFPEGCGLSCVAMVILDAAFHRWHQCFFPLCTALSYVDDWQILCPHSSLLARAKQCLDLFVRAVDLQLDAKKSWAWSLSGEGRSLLRSQGFAVALAAKNLGAHVQLSRKHTNFSLMDRIQGMQALWPRLRLSACRYRSKIRALMVAAWPKALHAVASTSLSDATFHVLRTGAMKGLDAEGAGCNAWVHLGMIEHCMIDPQFWSIIQTIRCARDCGDPTQVGHMLCKLVNSPDVVPANSISATLLTRLQTLGWHVGAFGQIHDQIGPFDLFHASMNEIVFRAQWAWQFVVAQHVSHRPGLANLQFADAGATRLFVSKLSLDDQELFRRCLNGCHITQDGKAYCQEGGSSQCPYCECSDSRFHRFWECDRFPNAARFLLTFWA